MAVVAVVAVVAVDLVLELVGYKNNLEIDYFVAEQREGYKNTHFDFVTSPIVDLVY